MVEDYFEAKIGKTIIVKTLPCENLPRMLKAFGRCPREIEPNRLFTYEAPYSQ